MNTLVNIFMVLNLIFLSAQLLWHFFDKYSIKVLNLLNALTKAFVSSAMSATSFCIGMAMGLVERYPYPYLSGIKK